MKSSAAPAELSLRAMLQKKDLARAVELQLGSGRIGGLDCCSAWYPARPPLFPLARVVKLVDTGDLKSPDHCDRAGSSPAPGTISISDIKNKK